jgi:hypothetical protein
MDTTHSFEHTLIRGMVLAVVLVGAATVSRLGSTSAGQASRDHGEEARLSSRDGRLSIEGRTSTIEGAELAGGLFSVECELDFVETAEIRGAGLSLLSEVDFATDAITIVDRALAPFEYGGYLELDGDLALANEAIVWINIGEIIVVNGETQLAGTLIVTYVESDLEAPAGEYVILAGEVIQGQFANLEWRGWPDNLRPRIEVRQHEIVVIVD